MVFYIFSQSLVLQKQNSFYLYNIKQICQNFNLQFRGIKLQNINCTKYTHSYKGVHFRLDSSNHLCLLFFVSFFQIKLGPIKLSEMIEKGIKRKHL